MQVQQHLSVSNVTRAATAWAASPVGRLVRVEVLVTLSSAMLAVLVLFGSGRRASSSTAFRVAIWCALMLSYPAVSYTTGLMQSACSFRNELTVTWGCFLLLLLGCADGIAAFSLNDSDQQTRTMLNQAMQIVYVLFLLLSYVGSLPVQLKALLFLLWALSTIKLGLRLRSFLLSGRARVLTDDNKLIADYMLHEHEIAGDDYDAAKMKGYNYIVGGETDTDDVEDDLLGMFRDGRVVTVDMVWSSEGKLLCSDDDDARRLKDLCLSFALFKLLRRRLGGFPLHESRFCKTRDFIKVGILAGEDDQERMYRVIEAELGFLFDLYYARYPSHKETLILDTTVFAAVVATSLSTLFCSALLDYHAPTSKAGNRDIAATASTRFDIWLTRGIIVLFLMLESFQYFTLVFSDWHKVKMLCRYVRERSRFKRFVLHVLLRLMCSQCCMTFATLTRCCRYWNNSIGQYNLLLTCIRHKKHKLSRIFSGFPSAAIEYKPLTATVKGAIHGFLKSEGLTRIRHGKCSLDKHGMLQKLSAKAIARSTVTARRILTWHIATTICDLKACELAPSTDGSREVAITLSDYCSYLMLSAPELLPDHSHDTKMLFSRVQQSAKKRLKDCKSKYEVYRELSKLPSNMVQSPDVVSAEAARRHKLISSHDMILAEGAELGRQLLSIMLEQDAKIRWNVLAELWVEMLLSLAPSNNMAGHVQKLATGGELITHLWALLTHAGVIEALVAPS